MKVSRRTLPLCVFPLLLGCSSPKQKLEKCQVPCAALKSELAKEVCMSSCERTVYGDFAPDKLASLCDKDDAVACLRFAVKATDTAQVAAKLQACCNRKNSVCCGGLGKMYSRGKVLKLDKEKGYALMEQACGLGDGTSCASPGLEQMGKGNLKRAQELFALGCDKDSPYACGLLGVLHRDGRGVPRDIPQAKKFLDKACRLGAEMSCKALQRL